MTRQSKRRTDNKPRRSVASTRRAKPGVARGRRGAAAKTKRAASTTKTKRAASRKRVAVTQTAQRRADELFEQQVHDVWNRFGEACRQFAEGFNSEIGANHLLVDVGPVAIVAKLAMGGELMVQLDHEHRHVGCYLTTQCGDLGSCVVEQPPVGLMADGDRLRWVFGVDPMAEDDLAVKLMTDLVQADMPPTSAASR